MTALGKIAVFYSVAAALIGLFVSVGYRNVQLVLPSGRILPRILTRPIAFLICAACWPYVLYKIVVGR